jgi:pilus assembly protein TadC
MELRQRLLLSAVAAAAITWALGGWLGLAAGPLLFGGGVIGLGRVPSNAYTKRQESLAAALPVVCDLLAVCMESGLPLRNALRALAERYPGPAGEVLSSLWVRVGLGADEASVWAEERGGPWGPLADEVCRSLTGGMALAASLRELAASTRKDVAAKALEKARSAGVRSVLPLMACFLPAFMLLGIVPIIGGIVGNFFG